MLNSIFIFPTLGPFCRAATYIYDNHNLHTNSNLQRVKRQTISFNLQCISNTVIIQNMVQCYSTCKVFYFMLSQNKLFLAHSLILFMYFQHAIACSVCCLSIGTTFFCMQCFILSSTTFYTKRKYIQAHTFGSCMPAIFMS